MAKLDEHIKSAAENWKGVDTDKFMDEIRGTDEAVTDCNELEEEIDKCITSIYFDLDGIAIMGATRYLQVKDLADIARHFAKWGAEHLTEKK